MPILLQATATAPGEARVEIRGADIANQEIEISIRRGSDEAFIGEDGVWQAQPYWHRLHRLPGSGIAFRAGPALVDALAEVASRDAFGATVRWDGGGPEDGVLRIKGELITRPPDGPAPPGPHLVAIEVQGATIPAEIDTIELAPAQTSADQEAPWCRLKRVSGGAATGFQGTADEMGALIKLTECAPSRARVRWGAHTGDGELRLYPPLADRAGGSDRNSTRFLLVLDPEPRVTTPGAAPIVTPEKPLASSRVRARSAAGLAMVLGGVALAAWLMTEPGSGPDPESGPRIAEASPETPAGPIDAPESDGTDGGAPSSDVPPENAPPDDGPNLEFEPEDEPSGAEPPVVGGVAEDPDIEIEPAPETPPIVAPAIPEPTPEVDGETRLTLDDMGTTARDPEAYRVRVERIKSAARPNCGELLLLYSKAAEARPEIAASVAQLYDPSGFQPSTCIDRPNAEQAMNYYSLAADGGIAEAEVAIQRLLGPLPTGVGAPIDPTTGESLRRIENRP
ncbi:hypothetical protein [Thiocapsa marina]|uniref:Uncharacterized protein n=1 Tax=Thiocapsa marina 5811 TaxID=768671 RepID=F9UIR7_9GAMM|nr:hypothetical protein [Thiocapsa marina]EGV15898.1 hypothetical protein ThimaDRAFT_4820 [Thiocapsa marina 5811]